MEKKTIKITTVTRMMMNPTAMNPTLKIRKINLNLNQKMKMTTKMRNQVQRQVY